jgi:hypothetical protein
LAALLLGVAASLPARQEKTGEKPVAAPPATPGKAEMDRLKFYLGEWEYIENYPKSAMAQNGATNSGIYTSKLGPGGNSLINTFHSRGPVGEFEGLLIITWDPGENLYKEYAFGGDFPGALVETGAFEGDALVFRAELKAGGRTMKMRNATRFTTTGTIESEQYVSSKEGPEKLLVKIVATRKQ